MLANLTLMYPLQYPNYCSKTQAGVLFLVNLGLALLITIVLLLANFPLLYHLLSLNSCSKTPAYSFILAYYP